jgi:glutaredoxin 3
MSDSSEEPRESNLDRSLPDLLRCTRRAGVRWATPLFVCALLVVGAGCDDPLAAFEQAKSAFEAGQRQAAAKNGPAGRASDKSEFADDENAKARAGGISLGPDHAKRLYYQFIDGKGRVRFVERMLDVPAQWRGRVGFVEMDTAPPLSPAMAESTRDRRYAAVADQYRKAPPRGRAMPAQIVLYSADWCGWCQKAKLHLDRQGVNYQVRDIDQPQNLQELVSKTGQKGIPVLDVGGKVVTGFSPERYDQLIRDART